MIADRVVQTRAEHWKVEISKPVVVYLRPCRVELRGPLLAEERDERGGGLLHSKRETDVAQPGFARFAGLECLLKR